MAKRDRPQSPSSTMDVASEPEVSSTTGPASSTAETSPINSGASKIKASSATNIPLGRKKPPSTKPTPLRADVASSTSSQNDLVWGLPQAPSTVPRTTTDSTTTRESKRSKKDKKANSGDADYSTQLEAHNIFYEKGSMSGVLLPWVRDIINRDRYSPGITDEESERISRLSDLLKDEAEAELTRRLIPFIAPKDDIESTTLACRADRQWHYGSPVPCVIVNPKRERTELTWPKPDLAYGFPRSAFTVDQYKMLVGLTDDDGQSFVCPDGRVYLPFCTWEAKSAKVAVQIARFQNANAASMAARCMFELIKRAGGGLTNQDIDPRQTAFFGVSLDNRVLVLDVTYVDFDNANQPRFNVVEVDTFLLNKPDSLRQVCRIVRNIVDVFGPERLATVVGLLEKIASKEKKAGPVAIIKPSMTSAS